MKDSIYKELFYYTSESDLVRVNKALTLSQKIDINKIKETRNKYLTKSLYEYLKNNDNSWIRNHRHIKLKGNCFLKGFDLFYNDKYINVIYSDFHRTYKVCDIRYDNDYIIYDIFNLFGKKIKSRLFHINVLSEYNGNTIEMICRNFLSMKNNRRK